MDNPTAARHVEAILSMNEALFRQMQAGSRHCWLDLHLSMPQLRMLHLLVTCGPHSPGALAEALRVSPATVTGICDGLVERGLAVREINPSDRRSNRVVVTEEGRRLMAGLWATHQEQWVKIMEVLSEKEQALVVEAFQVLLRAFERVATEDSR